MFSLLYVPRGPHTGMSYKNIKKWNHKTDCEHKMKLQFLLNLILFFIRSFNHQGSRISYITLYGGVFFFHFMPVFQGLVSTEHEWLWKHLGNEDLWSTILILLYGWFDFFWKLPTDHLLNMVVIHSMMYLYCVLCVPSLCYLRFPLLWFQVRLWISDL